MAPRPGELPAPGRVRGLTEDDFIMATTQPTGKTDATAIRHALRLLVEPGQVVELRVLNTPRSGTVSGYFSDIDKLAQAAARWSGNAPAVYFTLNPVNPALLARASNRVAERAKSTTSDRDIQRRRWFFIDFDPRRPAGISATDAEHQAALERSQQCRDWLGSMGWPSSVEADSGNGGHLHYLIDLPNDAASAELLKRCLQALGFQFSDDLVEVDCTTYNAARITKVYGTLACKGDNTADRPHRLSRLLAAPEPLVTVPKDLLEALAALVPDPKPRSEGHSAQENSRAGGFDLERWITEHNLPVVSSGPWNDGGKKWVLNPCPWNEDHDNRAAYIVQFRGGAIAAGCHHNSCADKNWHTLRDLYEPDRRGRRKPGGESEAARNGDAGGRETEEAECYTSFPIHFLPEPVRSFVEQGSRCLGCDAAYVALPVLSALSAVIGNTRRIRLKRTWFEPAVLWAVIVGESGTMKSPALELPLQPIYRIQVRKLAEYEQAVKAYEAERLRYEVELAQWKKASQKALTSQPPEKPEPPACVRLICGDITIEKLAAILGENPRGVLVTRDEVATWFASFVRYKPKGASDAAAWLEVHRAGTLIVDRKTGEPRTIFVRRAAVSITGGIQPGTLRRVLTTEYFENGLAARVLLAMPPRRPKKWSEVELAPEVSAAYEALIDRLWGLAGAAEPAGDGGLTPIDLPLDPAAKQAWIRFFDEHGQEQARLTGELAAAWSKLEGYAARLALLVHLVRAVSGDPSLAGPERIDAASIEAGVGMVRWFAQEARRVYGQLGESVEEQEYRQLIELIEVRGGTMSPRELQRSCRRHRTADEARAALDALAKAGRGVWEPPPSGSHAGARLRLLTRRHADSADSGPGPGCEDALTATPADHDILGISGEISPTVGAVNVSARQQAEYMVGAAGGTDGELSAPGAELEEGVL
jgi:hypothetical protein